MIAKTIGIPDYIKDELEGLLQSFIAYKHSSSNKNTLEIWK